jgi:hypothetical protein
MVLARALIATGLLILVASLVGLVALVWPQHWGGAGELIVLKYFGLGITTVGALLGIWIARHGWRRERSARGAVQQAADADRP